MWDIQVAVYSRLTSDATLMALVTGVYDEPPESANMPFVHIGEMIETPRNMLAQHGRSTLMTLHVWTSGRSNKSGLAIAKRVTELLDRWEMTVPGQHVVSVKYEFSQTLRDPKPEVRHIPIRFRVTTERTS